MRHIIKEGDCHFRKPERQLALGTVNCKRFPRKWLPIDR
ncbi:hypothetical protein THTE_1500 [Thermogutta terrifontis]|uniref:Uncharacterized protein n=1 Tax=Thermogutta terrifontis TaxID=1331910 RepID=A0A286RDS9_9BACT|nr:hypothetical protein THTE_1500 [Thermogutta terrifontis]